MKLFSSRTIIVILLQYITVVSACAQGNDKMGFEEYDPASTLVVPEHITRKAKFPFIDVHNHQWSLPTQSIDKLIKDMDSLHMQVMINLSGRSYKESAGRNGFFDIQDHDYLVSSLQNVNKNYKGRIMLFTNISFVGFGESGWLQKTVSGLEADVKSGTCGLKIYKDLGMEFKDEKGNFIRIDDPRLDPVWAKCGELGIPVIIHSADPKSFWLPFDKHNERWLELETHPDRKKSNDNPASWDSLIAQQHRMFKKHPETKFIAAHFGWLANDLGTLSKLLDEMPNVYIEFGAVISDIGRQPMNAKAFFTKYQNRILFGKDSWVPGEYATYFRELETNDEYFPYHKKYHAFWRMYGLGLSDDVLKNIYYKNAINIIPGIDKTMFPD